MKIDITDLDKCEVLAALCNNTVPLGMGKLNLMANTVITPDICADAFAAMEGRAAQVFDYFCGRPIKVCFLAEGDKLFLDRTWNYDRDSTKNVADILAELRLEKAQDGETKA